MSIGQSCSKSHDADTYRLSLKATQLTPTPGPLHLPCPLPEMLSPAPLPGFHVVAPCLDLGLRSNATSLEKPSLSTLAVTPFLLHPDSQEPSLYASLQHFSLLEVI